VTIRSTFTDGGAVVQMVGSMDARDLSALHLELLDHLRSRRRSIVLDFQDVDHVSYRDASQLAREFELVRSYQGDLRVAGLSPYVRNILVFAGLACFLEGATPDSATAYGPGAARVPRAS